MRLRLACVIMVTLVLVPAVASGATTSGTLIERIVHRNVASPGPVAGLDVLADRAMWRVDVAQGHMVRVHATAPPTQPFWMHWTPEGEPRTGSPVPASIQTLHLPGPKHHLIEIDPIAGANIQIVVRFSGYVGDVGGAPAVFSLTDIKSEIACVRTGVCLS